MKNLFFYLIAGILIIHVGSCQKEVILELSDQEGLFLVVEANIDDNNVNQWIRLSKSSSYYDISTGRPVSNASVIISMGDSMHEFAESHVDTLAGYYVNGTLARVLRRGTYQLSIDYDGKLYTAQSEYRPVPRIDSVSIDLNFFSSSGFTRDTLYDIKIHFRNPAERGAYYLIDLYINGRLQTGRPSQKTVISDSDLEDYVSLAVKTINQNDLEGGDMIGLSLRSISREAYDFYQAFFFQTDLSGNPFAGAPPANIPTNMSEGALGLFQVSSVSTQMRSYAGPNR